MPDALALRVAHATAKTALTLSLGVLAAFLLVIGPLSWPKKGPATRWPHAAPCEPGSVVDTCTARHLLWLWLPPAVAGIAAVALTYFQARNADAHQAATAARAAPRPSPARAALARLWQGQVPPARFWAVLSGGLTGAELAGVALWVVMNVVWLASILGTYLDYESSGDYARDSAHLRDNPRWAILWGLTAKAFASLMFPNLVLLFFPVSRGSVLLQVLGLPYPAAIRYHRWLGGWVLVLSAFHGATYWISWAVRYGTAGWVARAWSFGGAKTNYAMGSIAFLASLVLIITSREIVRRRFYKVFYWAHRLGFWVFIIGGVIHYNSLFWWALPGLMFYAIDLAYRLVQAASAPAQVVDAWAPGDGKFGVTSLVLARPVHAIAASTGILWLNVPAISLFEYHPFTFSEGPASAAPSPDDRAVGAKDDTAKGASDTDAPVDQPPAAPTMLVHVKAYDAWTRKLLELVREKGPAISVRVQGPYLGGTPVLRPEAGDNAVVVVAGGIGITECLAAIQEIPTPPLGLPFLLIWTVRHPEELLLLAPRVVAAVQAKGFLLTARFYYTGALDELQAASKGGSEEFAQGSYASERLGKVAADPSNERSSSSCPVLSLGSGLGAQASLNLAVHVLAFAGTLAAIIIIRAASVTGAAKPWHVAVTGTAYIVAIAAAATLPVILLLTFIKPRRATPAPVLSAPPCENSLARVVAGKPGGSSPGLIVPALTNLIAAPDGGVDSEQQKGEAFALHLGRPQLRATISSWVAGLGQLPGAAGGDGKDGSGAGLQVVFCGMGPERLVEEAQVLCDQLAREGHGGGGRPASWRFVPRTHSL